MDEKRFLQEVAVYTIEIKMEQVKHGVYHEELGKLVDKMSRILTCFDMGLCTSYEAFYSIITA